MKSIEKDACNCEIFEADESERKMLLILSLVGVAAISKWVELYCRTWYRLVMAANTRNLVMDFPCMLDTRHFSRGNNFERAAVPPMPNTSYPLELETYSRFLRSRRTRNATSTKSILRCLRARREIFDAPYIGLRKGNVLTTPFGVV